MPLGCNAVILIKVTVILIYLLSYFPSLLALNKHRNHKLNCFGIVQCFRFYTQRVNSVIKKKIDIEHIRACHTKTTRISVSLYESANHFIAFQFTRKLTQSAH